MSRRCGVVVAVVLLFLVDGGGRGLKPAFAGGPPDVQRPDPATRPKILLEMVADRLVDLSQFVFMTDRFQYRPQVPPLQQLAELIQIAEALQTPKDAETIYEQYLLFDEKVLAIFRSPDHDLELVLDALRRRYVELARTEVEGWTPAVLGHGAPERDLDVLAKRLATPRGDEVKGAGEIRASLEGKYSSLLDEEVVSMDLDRIQQEIAKWKGLRGAEFSFGVRLRLERLTHRYLLAFGAWLRRGDEERRFTIGSTEFFDAARDRIAEDRRAWHPFVSLTLLREILNEGSDGMYKLMLEQPRAIHEERIRLIRENQYATQSMSEEEKTRLATRDADNILEGEEDALWTVLSRGILDGAPSVLADSTVLGVDVLKLPVRVGVDVFDRVYHMVVQIDREPRYRELRERLRSAEGSTLLAPAVSRAVEGVLGEPWIASYLRIVKLQQLADILVIMQTRESELHLVRLFEFSDRFRYGEGRMISGSIEAVLVVKIFEFIERSLQHGPDRSLGLDIIDRLLSALREDVQVTRESGQRPVLTDEKVLTVLAILEKNLPGSMVEYIRWTFGGDQSALAPVRCEAVIFHLADVLVEYAKAGRYLKRDIDVAMGRTDGQAGPLPVHEQVMASLRWINGSLGRVPEIPDVSYGDLEKEQRRTLEKIYEGFEGDLARRNPRYIETLLQLAQRLAHAASPSDMKKRVYAAFATAMKEERALASSGGRWSPFITGDMVASLEMMWRIMGERGRPFDGDFGLWPAGSGR